MEWVIQKRVMYFLLKKITNSLFESLLVSANFAVTNQSKVTIVSRFLIQYWMHAYFFQWILWSSNLSGEREREAAKPLRSLSRVPSLCSHRSSHHGRILGSRIPRRRAHALERDPRHQAGRPKRRRSGLRCLHSYKALPLHASPQLHASPLPHVPFSPQSLLHRRLRRQDLDLSVLLPAQPLPSALRLNIWWIPPRWALPAVHDRRVQLRRLLLRRRRRASRVPLRRRYLHHRGGDRLPALRAGAGRRAPPREFACRTHHLRDVSACSRVRVCCAAEDVRLQGIEGCHQGPAPRTDELLRQEATPGRRCGRRRARRALLRQYFAVPRAGVRVRVHNQFGNGCWFRVCLVLVSLCARVLLSIS